MGLIGHSVRKDEDAIGDIEIYKAEVGNRVRHGAKFSSGRRALRRSIG